MRTFDNLRLEHVQVIIQHHSVFPAVNERMAERLYQTFSAEEEAWTRQNVVDIIKDTAKSALEEHGDLDDAHVNNIVENFLLGAEQLWSMGSTYRAYEHRDGLGDVVDRAVYDKLSVVDIETLKRAIITDIAEEITEDIYDKEPLTLNDIYEVVSHSVRSNMRGRGPPEAISIQAITEAIWQEGQEQMEEEFQAFEYQPPDMSSAKRDQLAKQDRERGIYVPQAEADTRHTYYTEALGPDYRDIPVHDYIKLADTTVGVYIDANPDHIVFMIKDADGKKTAFVSLRSQVREHMAVYDCDDDGKKYISLANLGYHGTGMASYDAVKTVVIHSNYQVFLLRRSEQNTGKLITHEIRDFEDDVVGGFHCQDGTQAPYYQIHVPATMI